MADNIGYTPGTGAVIAADDVGTVLFQKVKLAASTDGTEVPLSLAEDSAHATTDHGFMSLAVRTDAPVNRSGTDGDYEPLQMSAGRLWVSPLGFPVTIQTDVTRPADTTAYAAADAISDSTTAPTTGGFTLTGAARRSGGSGIITDMVICSSNDPATPLVGEIWLFNQAVTNINDNATFAVSDAEIKTCIGVVPFGMFDAGNNNYCHVSGLNFMFTCVGTANLRFLIRTRNAYTPASAEVFTIMAKILQID